MHFLSSFISYHTLCPRLRTMSQTFLVNNLLLCMCVTMHLLWFYVF
jgi:hypothetical protein